MNKLNKNDYNNELFVDEYGEYTGPGKDKYINYLEKYCYRLIRALDKACEEWEIESRNCNFLILKEKLCDEKCGYCNTNKRIKMRKEWSLQNGKDY